MKKLAPLKRFGQNFLIDENIAQKIVNCAGIEEGDFLVEIGPGKGALTRYLLGFPNSYLGIEIDRGLFELLSDTFREKLTDNKKVIQHDALLFSFANISGNVNVIANLPYNVASLIIIKLTKEIGSLKSLTCMVQKEMSERIFARHGTSSYGRLSVLIQNLFRGSVLFNVPSQSFFPRPKVKSSVIRLIPSDSFYEKREMCVEFENFLRNVFSQPRKMLKNVLKEDEITIFNAYSSDFVLKRPSELSPNDYWKLFELIMSKG